MAELPLGYLNELSIRQIGNQVAVDIRQPGARSDRPLLQLTAAEADRLGGHLIAVATQIVAGQKKGVA
jgi:hypothetical protein